jgi:hypothetical protein
MQMANMKNKMSQEKETAGIFMLYFGMPHAGHRGYKMIILKMPPSLSF